MEECKISCFMAGSVVGAAIIVILIALGFMPEQVEVFGVSFPLSTKKCETVISTETKVPPPIATAPFPSYNAKIEAVKSLEPIFGPESGILISEEDGYIEEYTAEVTVQDFITEVVFYVPDAPSWDMGFMFRQKGDFFYLVSVRSDGKWKAFLRLGDAKKDQTLREGSLNWLNLHKGARIQMSLWCAGGILHIFINEQYIATVNVSDLQERGDISVIIDAFAGDDHEGTKMLFEDFTVWPSP